jgi:hypothetical protein
MEHSKIIDSKYVEWILSKRSEIGSVQ